MRISTGILIFLLFFTFSLYDGLLGKPPFKDVKSSHWSYDAITELVKSGIIKGFPNSSRFRGRKSLTRYEMAIVVKEIIDKINSDNQKALSDMSTQTMSIVESLINEYAIEINKMMLRFEKLEKKTDKIDYKVEKVNSKINKLKKEQINKKEISQQIDYVQKENDRRFLIFLLAIAVLAVKVF